jgi:hypothetical protein
VEITLTLPERIFDCRISAPAGVIAQAGPDGSPEFLASPESAGPVVFEGSPYPVIVVAEIAALPAGREVEFAFRSIPDDFPMFSADEIGRGNDRSGPLVFHGAVFATVEFAGRTIERPFVLPLAYDATARRITSTPLEPFDGTHRIRHVWRMG